MRKFLLLLFATLLPLGAATVTITHPVNGDTVAQAVQVEGAMSAVNGAATIDHVDVYKDGILYYMQMLPFSRVPLFGAWVATYFS